MMKHTKPRGGISRRNEGIGSRSTAVGHGSASMSPPEYGIELADRAKAKVAQRKKNRTGMPDRLKAGIENLSGQSMDDVKVHYNSSEPAKLRAMAYTQGTDIHLGPGHERHLPHEAWHVVQQKERRVEPTTQWGKSAVNDDRVLEREADVMGAKAMEPRVPRSGVRTATIPSPAIVQRTGKFTKPPGIGETLLRAYNAGRARADIRNVGTGPTGDQERAGRFVAGVGTRHHIIPKSSFEGSLETWSKFQNGVSRWHKEAGLNSWQQGKRDEHVKRFNALAKEENITNTGGSDNINNTYWLKGNLFAGIATDYRLDDPGNGRERKKPPSMPRSQWDDAVAWGTDLVALRHTLGEAVEEAGRKGNDNIDGVFQVLDRQLRLRDRLSRYDLFWTSDAEDEDWQIGRGLPGVWGAAAKIYELV